MRRTKSILIGMCLVTGSAATSAWAQEKQPGQKPEAAKPDPAKPQDTAAPKVAAKPAESAEPQPLCPVTGRPIDRKIVVEFRGKNVYFADAAAKKKFEDNPDPYLDAVKAQWAVLRPLRTQVKCPVTGKPVDLEVSVERGDELIYFATKEAKEQWVKDPKPFERKLEEQCYTFQTTCAVCNHEIKPHLFAEIKGRTIYVGCAGCVDSLKAEPDLYLGKIDEQVAKNKAAWEVRQAAKKKAAGEKK